MQSAAAKPRETWPTFSAYATAYAVLRGRRYTLAMCRMRAKQRMEHVVRTLLARVVTLGIRMTLLLRGRGFYSVRGLQDLWQAWHGDGPHGVTSPPQLGRGQP